MGRSSGMTTGQLENPVTKERFVITHSGPDLLRLEVHVPADMIRPPRHVHRRQRESFEVLQGRVTLRAGKDQHVLGPGGRFAVPPGTSHTWWNSGDGEARLLAEFEPPGGMQSFFDTFCGMAGEGRCGATGSPPFLQIA